MVEKTKPTQLTQAEVDFLISGGALGIETDQLSSCGDAAVTTEYTQLVETGLTEDKVAKKLGVSINRIRQRIKEGSLYAVEHPSSGRICPEFQFFGDTVLRGVEVVLASINRQAHPVAVQRFFLAPNPDLVSNNGDTLSPREWLISGHSPDPVVLLAAEL